MRWGESTIAATRYGASAAAAALLACLTACGGGAGAHSPAALRSPAAGASVAARTPTATDARAPASARADRDGDGSDDPSGGFYDGDDRGVRYFGHAAGRTDARQVASLVASYYRAAATANGALACSLVEPSFAKALPEVNDSAPDSPHPTTVTCAAAMSRLLEHIPGRPQGRSAPAAVLGVRVLGDLGYALLRTAAGDAHYLPVVRTGSGWKLQSLFDMPLL